MGEPANGKTPVPHVFPAWTLGAITTAAAFGLVAVLGAGCQQPSSPARPASARLDAIGEGASAPAASPSPSVAAAPDTDALFWWNKTRNAARTVPVRASVVVTRFHAHKPPTISRYEMLEARGGRKYRITYHAPASAAGRIVLCDGQTLWQYEPNHDTVLRRPVSDGPSFGASAAFPSTSEAADTSPADAAAPSDKNEDVLPASSRVVLEPEADSVAGRATRVLALHATPGGGPVVERRWVDSRTGRTLRTEQYDAQNKKTRRVEMTQVEFSPTIEPGEFLPRLAPGVRIVDTTQKNPLPTRNRREIAETARRVHLPLRAREFVLHSAATATTDKTTHLVYTNGTAAVSVFVTPTAAAAATASSAPNTGNEVGKNADTVLTGAAGWKPVLLKTAAGQSLRTWTQETPTRTAVAWTQNHDRLVAVGQMPGRDLLPVVEALVRGK